MFYAMQYFVQPKNPRLVGEGFLVERLFWTEFVSSLDCILSCDRTIFMKQDQANK